MISVVLSLTRLYARRENLRNIIVNSTMNGMKHITMSVSSRLTANIAASMPITISAFFVRFTMMCVNIIETAFVSFETRVTSLPVGISENC